MPEIEPPVPTETTIASISPPVCSQSSGRGRLVVRLRVRLVRVLVGLEAAGDLLGEPVGDRVVALRRVVLDGGRRDHDLGAVRAQRRDLLLAHLVRHHEDAAVALVRGRDREPDAGVARRRLDDRPAGLEPPVTLGGLDHRDPDAILVRAAGVHELELCEQRRAGLAAEGDEADDRRRADEVEDGRIRARHTARKRIGAASVPDDAARADDRAAARGERLDLDGLSRLRSVDHPAATDVHADVAEAAEEEEVAGPEPRRGTGRPTPYSAAALWGRLTPSRP